MQFPVTPVYRPLVYATSFGLRLKPPNSRHLSNSGKAPATKLPKKRNVCLCRKNDFIVSVFVYKREASISYVLT